MQGDAYSRREPGQEPVHAAGGGRHVGLAERQSLIEALPARRAADRRRTGLRTFERAGGELLFDPLADRYELRSTIVTTNLALSEWVRVFGDKKLTTALLDRLSQHAHVLTTRGPSYRTRRRTDQGTIG